MTFPFRRFLTAAAVALSAGALTLGACGRPDTEGSADAGVKRTDGGSPDAGAPRTDGGTPGADGGTQAENTNELCSDGKSNDGDKYVDCDDFDCTRSAQVTVCGSTGAENTDELCSDGKSNDGDRYVDCDDFDCTKSAEVTVCGGDADPCFDCIDRVVAAGGACEASVAACEADAACTALLDCFDGCEDEACDAACEQTHAAGVALFNAGSECIDRECATACEL